MKNIETPSKTAGSKKIKGLKNVKPLSSVSYCLTRKYETQPGENFPRDEGTDPVVEEDSYRQHELHEIAQSATDGDLDDLVDVDGGGESGGSEAEACRQEKQKE